MRKWAALGLFVLVCIPEASLARWPTLFGDTRPALFETPSKDDCGFAGELCVAYHGASVWFDHNDATVPSDGKPGARHIEWQADVLTRHLHVKVVVVGYSSDDEEPTVRLRRATAVKSALMARGVSEDRVRIGECALAPHLSDAEHVRALGRLTMTFRDGTTGVDCPPDSSWWRHPKDAPVE